MTAHRHASQLQLSVARILATRFERVSTRSVHLLTEVCVRYVELLGRRCAEHGEHAGRRRPNAWDVVCALQELTDVAHIVQWLQQGRARAPSGASSIQDVRGQEVHYTAVPREIVPDLELMREMEEQEEGEKEEGEGEGEGEAESSDAVPRKRRAITPDWFPDEHIVLHDVEHAGRLVMQRDDEQRVERRRQATPTEVQRAQTGRIAWDASRVDDLPTQHHDHDDAHGTHGAHDAHDARDAPAPSSMRAFANDYRTLLRESSSAPTATLTPSSSAHASSLATRRSLALSLANRRRFDPSDSLYEGASARPTCSPFAPAPSHLVTSSGAFAPLKPHGRSTHPIAPLPSSTNTAMRAAVGTALSRRVQRTKDPLPVYDAAGVERVFHGAPASREHFKPLVDVENALSAAIRSLLADSAREAACAAALASQDEGAMEGRQEEEAVLDMQRAGALIATNPLAAQQAITASSHVLNSANEERPKEGVLVHTWDWTARDYKDVDALPGKRIRGT